MALNVAAFRLLSSNTFKMCTRFSSAEPYKFVLTDDSTTYVTWHPTTQFPYDCTKPLPVSKEEDTSVLKTQLTSEVKEIFNKKSAEQSRMELMNITHTTKHRWFPRSRDRKAKKTPMDREYL